MKKVMLLIVVSIMLLTTMIGCSEYISPNDPSVTGESITPEQMVAISKEMQQAEASPTESSVIENSVVETVQTEAVTVAPTVVESTIATQTEVPAVGSSTIESTTVNPVQNEAPSADHSTIETSFVEPDPSNTTILPEEPVVTTEPSTTTTDHINETPLVPMVTEQPKETVPRPQEFTSAPFPDEGNPGGDSQTVYWTPGGSVWHVTKACSSLSRSKEIIAGSVASAQAAGKDRACKRCG